MEILNNFPWTGSKLPTDSRWVSKLYCSKNRGLRVTTCEINGCHTVRPWPVKLTVRSRLFQPYRPQNLSIDCAHHLFHDSNMFFFVNMALLISTASATKDVQRSSLRTLYSDSRFSLAWILADMTRWVSGRGPVIVVFFESYPLPYFVWKEKDSNALLKRSKHARLFGSWGHFSFAGRGREAAKYSISGGQAFGQTRTTGRPVAPFDRQARLFPIYLPILLFPRWLLWCEPPKERRELFYLVNERKVTTNSKNCKAF